MPGIDAETGNPVSKVRKLLISGMVRNKEIEPRSSMWDGQAEDRGFGCRGLNEAEASNHLLLGCPHGGGGRKLCSNRWSMRIACMREGPLKSICHGLH